MDNKREEVLRLIYILMGSLITAISINIFTIPHKLVSGGVSGIALIIQYLTGIPTGYMVFLINIPIFIFGIKEVDKDFIIHSLIGTVALSVFLVLTRNLSSYFYVKDILLSCIYAGVFGGIGIGIVLRNRGSQGGTDIIAVVVKRRYGISIASVSFIINIVIVIIGAVLNNVEIALYTLISMYVSSVVLNRVIEGFDRKKLLFIVTKKDKEVSQAIMNEIGRGVTFFYGEGAYTNEKRNVIFCIVTSFQVARTKKVIEDIDKSAFISILDAAEVEGKGF
ncbi:MAG TPA: YitT family protein, partial [Clostridiaceae bacterium]|nr:YitT family protein [Clostridiaceae bacterium]